MRITKLILIGFLLINSGVFAQQAKKVFSVFPELPNPGEEIIITYNSENTALKNSKTITGLLYTYNNFKWIVSDLSLKKESGNIWKAQVRLADKAALIACVFKTDTLIDNGGKIPYVWMLDKVPGSYFAWGLLRNKTLEDERPSIVSDSTFIDDSVSLFWVNNEMKYHPESRDKIFYEGLKLMKASKKGNHTARIKKEIQYILGLQLDNVQQYKLQRTLGLLSQQEEKTFIDSVQNVLLKKYPKGVLARDNSILNLFRESDPDKKINAYKDFEQNFPQENFKDVYTQTEALYYDKAYKSVAYTYIANKNDYSFVFDNLSKAPFSILLDYSWHLVTIPYDREIQSVDSLKVLADKIVSELEKRETIIPKAYKNQLSPNQWKEKFLNFVDTEYLTYVKILEKTKNYKETKVFLEKIKPNLEYKNSDFNYLYTKQLLRDNKKEDAIHYIKDCLKVNNVTPEMLEILRKNHEGGENDEESFSNYMTTLKSNSQVVKDQYNKVISELINKPIEGFKLESIKGGKVELKKQEGKIVVIDMWATWCAPCKKAMPGMQMAVTKYATDNAVKFYFIDTQEFVKNYKEKVRAFIAEKGYTFNVLFDEKNPETGKLDNTYSKYSKAFKFSGIPQKMIIDAKGNLRWRSTGYMGSPSELADEISIIIEYLKNEK